MISFEKSVVSVWLNACLVYVGGVYNREKVSKDKQGFIERVVDCFGRDLRRLQLMFPSDAGKSCLVK